MAVFSYASLARLSTQHLLGDDTKTLIETQNGNAATFQAARRENMNHRGTKPGPEVTMRPVEKDRFTMQWGFRIAQPDSLFP